ncbi:pathway-specific nitrogen regulator [Moniliophthora roreri MCA 2997]|uniref:Pathway-specific nitrogen regulator n=2 Tax=Moniliophthora roreri TaxID=221103 RepID=V2X8A3_MONRO|nr:pathway-specific nitrogen regulator [Moniliophthora roreri MCA 2997]
MEHSQSPQEFSKPSPQSISSDYSPLANGSSDTSTSNTLNKGQQNDPQPSEKRVPLACLRCRAKRARCSGEKPTCNACQKVNEVCVYPAGRKRKRTRKEMEEQERLDREAAQAQAQAAVSGVMHHLPTHQEVMNGGYPRNGGHMLQRHSHQPIPSTSYNPGISERNPIKSPIWVPSNAHVMSGSPHTNMWSFPMPGSLLTPSYIWPGQPKAQTMSPPSDHLNIPQFGGVAEKKAIVRALKSQVAYIDGDPTRREDLELYYYRFSGSTAIHPGINRISLKLQPCIPKSSASAPMATAQSKPGSPEPPDQMFDDSGLPLPSVYVPLLNTFFRTMSRHFPSISRKRMEERLETGTMSAFLLNCICAIGARFHPAGSDSPSNACVPFITKAQELIIPLLHLPTTDVVTGLLLLAWANYGQNSDSGLWQYSGMAIRMALDLGLHEISEIYESMAHVVRTRLLFWSLFITDRILAFSTGRPPSISEEIIEIPLPTDEDFFPDPARTNDPTALGEEVQPVPFQYLVRLLVICGRIASVLNGRRGRLRTLVGPGAASGMEVLSGLQAQLVQFYAELPEEMKWSVEDFKRQEARGHGGTYLTLHLWANAVMALVYHPELLSNPSGTETPVSQTMNRSIKLALASSRTISECLVFTDLLSSQSYLYSPHAVQPIYVACLAFIQDMKLSALESGLMNNSEHQSHLGQSSGQTEELLLTSMAKQNLSVLIKALGQMEHYWAGVSYVSSILEQRARGLAELGFNLDARPKAKKTFISLPDKGLLKRFTNPNLPHNTAAPTEMSLRASMAKEAADAATYSLDDLLSSYSVEGFYIQPANNFDLQSLITSGGMGHGHGETPLGVAVGMKTG